CVSRRLDVFVFFFFSSRRRHTRFSRDWSSDVCSSDLLSERERTYSAPLAIRQFTKETELVNGEPVRDYPRLMHAGLGVDDTTHWVDVRERLLHGLWLGLGAAALLGLLLTLAFWRTGGGPRGAFLHWWQGRGNVPWRVVWATASVLVLALSVALVLSSNYHVLGTDQTGNDVLRQCLKSVRTALVIGTLTTVA